MDIENKAINTIRKLGLNMVEQAGSGHTGIILGGSPIIYSIYHEAKVNPKEPDWINRDRVILSGGHGSAMLYAILHLMGYAITLSDMYEFRKIGSITPGHPETNITPGVDASTGALGQGFANAVGIAMCEKHLSNIYNRPSMPIIDHYTYVMCGDGDLMEGVSYESASLAGKQQLNKLIVLYDCNDVTLDNPLDVANIEDTRMRFESMGWNVLEVDNDQKNIIKAIRTVKKESKAKPSLIICHTVLGDYSQFAGTPKAHGNPFNKEDFAKIIKNLDLSEIPFRVTLDVYKHFHDIAEAGKQAYQNWKDIFDAYKKKYRVEYKKLFNNNLASIADKLTTIKWKDLEISTRSAMHNVLNELAKYHENVFGGTADLSSSTKAYIDDGEIFAPFNPKGRNIAFGVREHAMSAVCNGIALHGGVLPFASTFLIFSDYMKYSMRMSAYMDLNVMYILTHDSIAVGQDGASHEPVEQLESMRLVPNLYVFRPADAKESIGCMQWYLREQKPVVFALSRQKLPVLDESIVDGVKYGGYIISREKNKDLNAILIATGSEVDIAIRTQKLLQKEGYSVRVVSMPCRELFDRQTKAYKEKILPGYFPSKMVIEAGVTNGWWKYVGRFGEIIGVNSFGESGTQSELYDLYGLTVANINTQVKAMIKRNKTRNVDL